MCAAVGLAIGIIGTVSMCMERLNVSHRGHIDRCSALPIVPVRAVELVSAHRYSLRPYIRPDSAVRKYHRAPADASCAAW